MDDPLEKYVIENRASFDDLEPSSKVWVGIQHRKTLRRDKYQAIWKVAAVLLLISTTYLIVERNFEATDTPTEQVVFMEDFEQAEAYYTRMISDKKATLIKVADEKMQRLFLIEIERLDEQYENLKKTYRQKQAGTLLTDAMINNLKMRIEILNKQLQILNELKKQQENENIISEI